MNASSTAYAATASQQVGQRLAGAFVLAGLFSVAINVLMLTVPIFMMQIYDRVLSSHSIETLAMLTIMAIGALAVMGVLEAVRQQLLIRCAARLETKFGNVAFRRTIDERGDAGRPNLLRDLSLLRQFISSPLMNAVLDAPFVPIYLVLLFVVHPHLGFVTSGAGMALVSLSLANQWLSADALSRAAAHDAKASEICQFLVRNADTVRPLGMVSRSSLIWGAAHGAALQEADRVGFVSAVSAGMTRFTRLLLQIVILGYGAFLVINDQLSPGIILAASIISARALTPLDQASAAMRQLKAAADAYRRLSKAAFRSRDLSKQKALASPDATIVAKELAFAHKPRTAPVLKGISFSITAGETIGITGTSGSGKSTLARLLVGAAKASAGTLSVGGYNITHWGDNELGGHIGYVSQDCELFPLTVAQNIARLSSDADPEAVVRAARFANCLEMIQNLPEGFDTVLGPDGVTLSRGDRQRIALARAFYGEPGIVVLDEPDAHLDPSGVSQLGKSLRLAKRMGVTCVVITHNPAILSLCSRVMHLQAGRIKMMQPAATPASGPVRRRASKPNPACTGVFHASTNQKGPKWLGNQT